MKRRPTRRCERDLWQNASISERREAQGSERQRGRSALAGRDALSSAAQRHDRRTRFDARKSIGRKLPEVNFVGRLALERRVRAMLVVPVDDRIELIAHCLAAQRNHHVTQRFLQGTDKSLHHGNAAVLADGAEPRANAASLAPALISGRRPELFPFIADQMRRRCSRGANRATEKCVDVLSCTTAHLCPGHPRHYDCELWLRWQWPLLAFRFHECPLGRG